MRTLFFLLFLSSRFLQRFNEMRRAEAKAGEEVRGGRGGRFLKSSIESFLDSSFFSASKTLCLPKKGKEKGEEKDKG
jgi:hypothetical protein